METPTTKEDGTRTPVTKEQPQKPPQTPKPKRTYDMSVLPPVDLYVD
jgi:hypothetical protein